MHLAGPRRLLRYLKAIITTAANISMNSGPPRGAPPDQEASRRPLPIARLFPAEDEVIGRIDAQLHHLWAIRQTGPFADRRVDIGPFRPYAILDGRSNYVLEATGTDLAHYLQRKLKKTLPSDDIQETQAVWRECLALADLARAILAEAHGGAILIVPSMTGEW